MVSGLRVLVSGIRFRGLGFGGQGLRGCGFVVYSQARHILAGAALVVGFMPCTVRGFQAT